MAGAELPPGIILILGVADLIADGCSMAASNYLATQGQLELRYAAAVERHHIGAVPEGEREEVREIFRRGGLDLPGLHPLRPRPPVAIRGRTARRVCVAAATTELVFVGVGALKS